MQSDFKGATALPSFGAGFAVFFVIELQTRRVQIAGIHQQPDGAWVEQMARTLTDSVDGFLRTARYLIHDRNPIYTRVVTDILMSGGVQPIRLPPRSPNLNAYAERFVRSIKEECLDRVVPLGEDHLRRLARRHRALPPRAKPSGTRQPASAAGVIAPARGHPRATARPPRRTPQFLPSRGRVTGWRIKRTLRGRQDFAIRLLRLPLVSTLP